MPFVLSKDPLDEATSSVGALPRMCGSVLSVHLNNVSQVACSQRNRKPPLLGHALERANPPAGHGLPISINCNIREVEKFIF